MSISDIYSMVEAGDRRRQERDAAYALEQEAAERAFQAAWAEHYRAVAELLPEVVRPYVGGSDYDRNREAELPFSDGRMEIVKISIPGLAPFLARVQADGATEFALPYDVTIYDEGQGPEAHPLWRRFGYDSETELEVALSIAAEWGKRMSIRLAEFEAAHAVETQQAEVAPEPRFRVIAAARRNEFERVVNEALCAGWFLAGDAGHSSDEGYFIALSR